MNTVNSAAKVARKVDQPTGKLAPKFRAELENLFNEVKFNSGEGKHDSGQPKTFNSTNFQVRTLEKIIYKGKYSPAVDIMFHDEERKKLWMQQLNGTEIDLIKAETGEVLETQKIHAGLKDVSLRVNFNQVEDNIDLLVRLHPEEKANAQQQQKASQ